jgi:hypothetical protein
MAGKKNAAGCPCCPTSGTQSLCVDTKTCAGAAAPGFPVTAKSGATTLTGTTDAAGHFCWTVPLGTWTVTVTFATRSSSQTVTVTAAAPVTLTFTDPGTVVNIGVAITGCITPVAAQITSVAISPTLTPVGTTFPNYTWALPATATFPYTVTIHYQELACCLTSPDGIDMVKTVVINDSDACHGSLLTANITSHKLCVTVVSCGSTQQTPLVGATVTSVSGGSATTDSNGHCCLSGTPNTASGNITVAHSRYSSLTVAGANFGCGGVNIDMSGNILPGYSQVVSGAACCDPCGNPMEDQAPGPVPTYTDSGGTVSCLPGGSACIGATGPNDCNGVAQSCHHLVQFGCAEGATGSTHTVINFWYAEDCLVGGVTPSGTRMRDNLAHDCAAQATGGPTHITRLQTSATATVTSACGGLLVLTGTWPATVSVLGVVYDVPGAGPFVIMET